MKKIASVILCGLISLSFVSCASKTNSSDVSNYGSKTSSNTANMDDKSSKASDIVSSNKVESSNTNNNSEDISLDSSNPIEVTDYLIDPPSGKQWLLSKEHTNFFLNLKKTPQNRIPYFTEEDFSAEDMYICFEGKNTLAASKATSLDTAIKDSWYLFSQDVSSNLKLGINDQSIDSKTTVNINGLSALKVTGKVSESDNNKSLYYVGYYVVTPSGSDKMGNHTPYPIFIIGLSGSQNNIQTLDNYVTKIANTLKKNPKYWEQN